MYATLSIAGQGEEISASLGPYFRTRRAEQFVGNSDLCRAQIECTTNAKQCNEEASMNAILLIVGVVALLWLARPATAAM